MKSIALMRSGVAIMSASVANFDGTEMSVLKFIVDTGATRTTIPKRTLVDELGYSEEYINKNKILLPERGKPLMADGKRADVYKLKAPRINIGGHELQPDYILTSDVVLSLNLLLGLDVLSYFNFNFNFDSIDEDASHGRMFYEFRQSRFKPFTKLDEPFAYKLSNSK